MLEIWKEVSEKDGSEKDSLGKNGKTFGKKEKERERKRKKDTGTQDLMEQGCFIQHSVGRYTVLQGSFVQQR